MGEERKETTDHQNVEERSRLPDPTMKRGSPRESIP
jgi:hypothetical protein